jgi:hypothetical protein
MKKEVNRYTLNFVIDGQYIAIAQSNLENIDHLSTNFEDKYEMINFLETYANVDFLADGLAVTYNMDKQTKEVDLLFKPARAIVDDKRLLDKLISFLNNYSSVNGLNISGLKNSYLRNLLYDLLEQRTVKEYDFKLMKAKEHLANEYKLKRDLSLFIDNELKRKKRSFLVQPVNMELDEDEVIESLARMVIVYRSNKPREIKPVDDIPYVETGDSFLDGLIANKDYDTISRMYDNEVLESLGVRNIFDGTHEVEERGKSK